MPFLSFSHLWDQSGQHILIRNWLALWAGRTSLHMTIPEDKHFCNVKISSESLLCAVGSCLQLSSWQCVLLPVKTVTACNQFCTLLQGGSSPCWQLQSSCSRSFCALFIIYLFCCQTAACEVFFFPLLCSWCVIFSDCFCLRLFFTASTSTTS